MEILFSVVVRRACSWEWRFIRDTCEEGSSSTQGSQNVELDVRWEDGYVRQTVQPLRVVIVTDAPGGSTTGTDIEGGRPEPLLLLLMVPCDGGGHEGSSTPLIWANPSGTARRKGGVLVVGWVKGIVKISECRGGRLWVVVVRLIVG